MSQINPSLSAGSSVDMSRQNSKSIKNIFDNTLSEIYQTGDQSAKLDTIQENDETEKIRNKINVEAKEYKQWKIGHNEGVFSMKWSPDGQLLAIGCNDGHVRVLNRNNGKSMYKLRTVGNMPCTSLRWRPGQDNILLTGNCNGEIQHWHVQSQKTIFSIKEEENQIFALDIRKDGLMFTTGGMDRKIRVYDEETKKIKCTMERGYMSKKPGHSNRVFSVKFKPDDPNVILSGSWDNTVLYWDIRTKGTFRSIFGPHIAGQSLDIQNDVIMTASWRSENTVQTWDFSTGKLLNTIEWEQAPMVYTASFSPDRENIIIAGGTGMNCAKLIDVKNGFKSPNIVLPSKKGIFAADFDPTGNLLAVAGDGDTVSIFGLKSVYE